MSELERLKEQVEELQSQMAFQEDTVQALNEAVGHQQQEMFTMRRQLELLKARQEEQGAGPSGEAPTILDEKPPHY
ncbi:MAG: SlyX family protein [Halioglobus sp.]